MTTDTTDNTRFGVVMTEETIKGVQRVPDPLEQVTINHYRARYKKAMGFAPHGLHYLPGLPDLGPVWLPPE